MMLKEMLVYVLEYNFLHFIEKNKPLIGKYYKMSYVFVANVLNDLLEVIILTF